MTANEQQQHAGQQMPPGFDPAIWQQFWNQMTANLMSAASAMGRDTSSHATSRAVPGSFDPGEISRQMQNALLDAMAKWCDDYLRSPQFLETMKKSLDTSLAMRREMEEFVRKASGNAFGDSLASGADPAGTMRAIEERLTEKMEEISGRLDAIEGRLEGKPRSSTARKKTTTKKKTTKKGARRTGSSRKKKATSRDRKKTGTTRRKRSS